MCFDGRNVNANSSCSLPGFLSAMRGQKRCQVNTVCPVISPLIIKSESIVRKQKHCTDVASCCLQWSITVTLIYTSATCIHWTLQAHQSRCLISCKAAFNRSIQPTFSCRSFIARHLTAAPRFSFQLFNPLFWFVETPPQRSRLCSASHILKMKCTWAAAWSLVQKGGDKSVNHSTHFCDQLHLVDHLWWITGPCSPTHIISFFFSANASPPYESSVSMLY